MPEEGVGHKSSYNWAELNPQQQLICTATCRYFGGMEGSSRARKGGAAPARAAAVLWVGLTMGLLKAVCLDSMLARLASARLPVRRCDLVLWLLCMTRTLWWLPMLPRWGREPPLGTASSSSESASWYLARRWAVDRGTWGDTSQWGQENETDSEHSLPLLS